MLQTNDVAGNGVIVHPALHDLAQPASGVAQRIVPSLAELLLDRSKFRPQTFRDAHSTNRKPAVLTSLPALVRESQEIECPGTTFATARPTFGRVTSKLDQPCLGVVELQAELHETLSEFIQTGLRVSLSLETN